MIKTIDNLDNPYLRPYHGLTERQLKKGFHNETPLFIAESAKVVERALEAGYVPESFLCSHGQIKGEMQRLLEMLPAGCDPDIFSGDDELLGRLTGYGLTRGVLCAMRRRELPDPALLLANGRRVAVFDGVVEATNIGAMFRSAAALGIDAVMITPSTCDPLNRRSVRVSMGGVFQVPWSVIESPLILSEYGYKTAAMALRHDFIPPDDSRLMSTDKLALILGNEGDGLSEEVISGADFTVCIPMAHGVDSLNVATAAAIAFWQLCKKNERST